MAIAKSNFLICYSVMAKVKSHFLIFYSVMAIAKSHFLIFYPVMAIVNSHFLIFLFSHGHSEKPLSYFSFLLAIISLVSKILTLTFLFLLVLIIFLQLPPLQHHPVLLCDSSIYWLIQDQHSHQLCEVMEFF